jgi:hypothetical protein
VRQFVNGLAANGTVRHRFLRCKLGDGCGG